MTDYSLTLCKGFIVKKGTVSFSYASESDRHRPYSADADFTVTSSAIKNISVFHPKKGEEYTVAEVGVSFDEFAGILTQPFNAVILDVTSGDASAKVFGWIDRAEEISVSAKTNTRLFWHIDWWLTALKMSTRTLSLLEGRIKRGPKSIARPDPSQPRMWEIGESAAISNDEIGPWAIGLISESETVGDLSFTTFSTIYWPTGGKITIGTIIYPTVSVINMYDGYTEEFLDLAPSSILGLWLSPIKPHSGSASIRTAYGNRFAYYKLKNGNIGAESEKVYPGIVLTTDDLTKTIVADPFGTICATLPWGIAADTITVKTDVGVNGASLYLHLSSDGKNSPGTGKDIQIPLISVPVTSNAMSDYVYSGQRDYDVYTAQLQAEQARKSGIAGAGTSIIGGAVAGAMVGNVAGAALGAIGGAASSLISSEVNYRLTREYSAKEQEAVDRLTSSQIASAILSGNGYSWHGETWKIVKLVRDPVSKTELETEQAEIGYLTDSQCSDCGAYAAMGGPLKIDGLRVEGLSPEGNKYIQDLFARGVNIDLLG